MLTALDHIVLLCRDFDKVVSDYEILFGMPPSSKTQDAHFNTALFQTGNTALEIMAPVKDGPTEERVKSILGERSSALTSLAYATDDIQTTHHTLTRRSLAPSDISDSERQTFRCDDERCAGIKTFILQTQRPNLAANHPNGLRLDHLVINSPNPERAIAHYGARLGIRFALDRTAEQFGTRFLFFKLDDLVLEVIHSLKADNDPKANDEIWGLTWKVSDLEAAHIRLSKSGAIVSEIRKGRKPGTKVFTAKSHTGNIPTLLLTQTPIR